MEIKSIEFTNWSGQYTSRPQVYAVPETAEDLKEIISDKEKFPSPVVAVGSGHSNSGCNIVNGGTAVYMKKFRNMAEPLQDEVTVGAGMQLFEVHRYLAERKLQLPFTPDRECNYRKRGLLLPERRCYWKKLRDCNRNDQGSKVY